MRVFSKELLTDIVNDDTFEYDVMFNDVIIDGWNATHECIFKECSTGKMYVMHYVHGECEPFENEGNSIEVAEVIVKDVMITAYVDENKNVIRVI